MHPLWKSEVVHEAIVMRISKKKNFAWLTLNIQGLYGCALIITGLLGADAVVVGTGMIIVMLATKFYEELEQE